MVGLKNVRILTGVKDNTFKTVNIKTTGDAEEPTWTQTTDPTAPVQTVIDGGGGIIQCPTVIIPGYSTSPPNPIQILGSALQVWLDANVGITQTSAKITTWKDQSSSGNDFGISQSLVGIPYNATGLNGMPTASLTNTSNLGLHSPQDGVAIAAGAFSMYGVVSFGNNGTSENRALSFINTSLPSGTASDFSSTGAYPWGMNSNGNMAGLAGTVVCKDPNTAGPGVSRFALSTPLRFGCTYNGTTFKQFLNGVQVSQQAVAKTWTVPITLALGYAIKATSGTLGDNGARGVFSISELVVANNAVSAANIILLDNYLAPKWGINNAANNRVLVFEGDSITHGFGAINGEGFGGYGDLFWPNASPTAFGSKFASDAATISTLSGRVSSLDPIATEINSRGGKAILSVLIGTNDLVSLGTATWLVNFAAYCDARRAAGWKVIVCTILPDATTGFNVARGVVNPVITSTWVGVHCDAIADFAADPTMGPDAACLNATYYQADNTHPTAAGHALLEAVVRPVINGL